MTSLSKLFSRLANNSTTERRSGRSDRHAARRLSFEPLEARRMFTVEYFGGPVISNVEVQPLFYGAGWYTAAGQGQANQLTQYLSYLTGSSYMDMLTEYDTYSQAIGHGIGLAGQSANPGNSPYGSTVDDGSLQQFVNYNLEIGHLRNDQNRLFVIFTDANMVVTMGGESSVSTPGFLGYHDSFTDSFGQTAYYAVIANPVGNSDIAGMSGFQQQTIVASHELAEAVTDPMPSSDPAWTDRNAGEIGDQAEGNFAYLRSYAIQAEWSNRFGGPEIPYGATLTPPQPLQIAGGYQYQAPEGASLDNALVASFYDPNGAGALGDYSATIDWGDGSGAVAGQVVPAGNGQFEVIGSHAYQGEGATYLITVTVSRSMFPNAAPVFSSVVVNNAPVEAAGGATYNSTPGATLSNANLATFVDPAGADPVGDYAATIAWGDGQTSYGTISYDPARGTFTVTANAHTYQSQGAFNVTVTIVPNGGTAVAVSDLAQVTRPALMPLQANGGYMIEAVQGTPLPNQTVATFTDPNGAGPVSNYSATIAWGDGQTSVAGGISYVSYSGANGTFTVTADGHSYQGQGVFKVVVTIVSNGGTAVTVGDTAQVTAVPSPTPPTPPTPPSGQTPDENYVTTVYEAVLGRAPQPHELQTWAGQLDAGLPRAAFVGTLDHEGEYFATIIEPAYDHYLGRQADASGLTYWITRMENGLTDEQLEAGFIGSSEFYAKAGGTDAGWVNALYESLLGRAADPAGMSHWLGALATGESRSDVAYGFTASPEREAQRIENDYFHYLGRQADQAGLDYWLAAFEHGSTNEDLITGFLASDEYFAQHSS